MLGQKLEAHIRFYNYFRNLALHSCFDKWTITALMVHTKLSGLSFFTHCWMLVHLHFLLFFLHSPMRMVAPWSSSYHNSNIYFLGMIYFSNKLQLCEWSPLVSIDAWRILILYYLLFCWGSLQTTHNLLQGSLPYI